MSKKQRFFYVISRVLDKQIVTSAVFRDDGSFFNCNETRAQVAKDLDVDVGDVYIASWQEFDSEQDYLDFHK